MKTNTRFRSPADPLGCTRLPIKRSHGASLDTAAQARSPMQPPQLKGLFVLDRGVMNDIYGPEERERIARHVHLVADPLTGNELASQPELLRGVEVLFSGWGGPKLDARLLAHADGLKTLFYGAGTLRYTMTEAAWDHGFAVTSAYAANAIPVAEFTAAQVVMGLKGVWQAVAASRRERRFVRASGHPGCYRSTVGLVSLGTIGRLVAQRLRDGFELRVLAYDPFAEPEDAAALGVELVELDELFAESDMVSVHTPWLAETEAMIQARHLQAMRPNATFLNTARGAVVDEPGLVEALRERPDLLAILDVTYPEPPPADSPLWGLPNVVITPHIAGSEAMERRRMGSCMADELDRFVAGEPLRWQVMRDMARRMA